MHLDRKKWLNYNFNKKKMNSMNPFLIQFFKNQSFAIQVNVIAL